MRRHTQPRLQCVSHIDVFNSALWDELSSVLLQVSKQRALLPRTTRRHSVYTVMLCEQYTVSSSWLCALFTSQLCSVASFHNGLTELLALSPFQRAQHCCVHYPEYVLIYRKFLQRLYNSQWTAVSPTMTDTRFYSILILYIFQNTADYHTALLTNYYTFYLLNVIPFSIFQRSEENCRSLISLIKFLSYDHGLKTVIKWLSQAA